MPTPLYVMINDDSGAPRKLSGDTFEFVDLDAGKGAEQKEIDMHVVEGVRDILFPAGSSSNDDAVFDNMVGFYEITDTDGGIDANSEDDLIA